MGPSCEIRLHHRPAAVAPWPPPAVATLAPSAPTTESSKPICKLLPCVVEPAILRGAGVAVQARSQPAHRRSGDSGTQALRHASRPRPARPAARCRRAAPAGPGRRAVKPACCDGLQPLRPVPGRPRAHSAPHSGPAAMRCSTSRSAPAPAALSSEALAAFLQLRPARPATAPASSPGAICGHHGRGPLCSQAGNGHRPANARCFFSGTLAVQPQHRTFAHAAAGSLSAPSSVAFSTSASMRSLAGMPKGQQHGPCGSSRCHRLRRAHARTLDLAAAHHQHDRQASRAPLPSNRHQQHRRAAHAAPAHGGRRRAAAPAWRRPSPAGSST